MTAVDEPATSPLEVPLMPCGHPVTRYYSKPGRIGRSGGWCRDCRTASQRATHGAFGKKPQRVLKVVKPRKRREDLSPLSLEKLAELRAQVACVGCGAVRVPRLGAQKAPFTTIKHKRGCHIARIRESAP